jgi:hypothetical protein
MLSSSTSSHKFPCPAPAQLMKLAPGLEWHSAYVINSRDEIQAVIRFMKDDLAVYISTQTNRFDSSERYRCLVGKLVVMFNPTCLVSCGDD